MSSLPFGLGAYSRGSDRLPRVRLINMLAEQTPTGKQGVALLQRPGLAPLYTPAGESRGFYKQDGVLGGDLFSVHDNVIYRNGSSVSSCDGSDLVEWAYTIDGLYLLAGGLIYASTDGGTFTIDTFPDDAPVSSIAAIDSILVAVRGGTDAAAGKVYYRINGESAWNGLDFFSAEREPDPALAVRNFGDELWVFGSTSIEPFYPTGDSDSPFARLDGRSIQRGVKSRDSIALMDNSIFWIGEDNKAYRDATAVRISDHGIEEQIEASANASAWTYDNAGHVFYVVNLDTQTLAYDAATRQWHQLRRNGSDLFVTTGIYSQGTTYVGLSGKVCTLDVNRSNDDGAALERLWTSVASVDAPVMCNAIQVGVSPGTSALGSPAALQLRYSDDEGRTWSDWESDSLGDEGEFRKRVIYRRLGMIDNPGRLFEHRITDDAPIRVSEVMMNPPMGGRGR